eukprot:6490620-Amphidinium_carterae.5
MDKFSAKPPCQIVPQDSEWALYQKADDNSGDIAAGEQCYTCFHFHKLCYPNLPWQQFINDYKSKEDFGEKVKDAKHIFHDAMEGKRLKFQEEEKIMDTWVVGVELERAFLAVSEKEMRQMASIPRVPKMALKGLPSITVPGHMSSDNEPETLFCFPDPHQPLRTVKMKYIMTNQLVQTKLEPQHVVYDEQAEELQAHFVGKASTEIGYDDLVKNVGNSMDWTTFLESKLIKAPKEDEQQGTGSGKELREPGLSGPAAKADGVYVTPPAKLKNTDQSSSGHGLLRGRSNMSLASASETQTPDEDAEIYDADQDIPLSDIGTVVDSEPITGERGR